MDNMSREEWLELCQRFFEAYADFRVDGTESHWIVRNNRNIEIAFLDCGDRLKVKMYCPEVLRSLSGYYGRSTQNTEEIIRMLYWLAWEAGKKQTYVIKTASPEEEYQQLRNVLVNHYRLCYDATWEDDYWKETGVERLIIKLHGREIAVHFSPNVMWDCNGYIDVSIYSFDTGRSCITFVQQKEKDPKGIIRLIQDMASEPDIIDFSTTDSEWEHDLLKEALVGGQTESGEYFTWCPFRCFDGWNEYIQEERRFYLHNRDIRIQFDQQGDHIDITIDCPATGRSYAFELPKRRNNAQMEELIEKIIRRIQELAWESK